MGKWRVLAGVVLIGVAGPALANDKFTLREPVQLGDHWRIAMSMSLTGQLHIRNGDKPLALKIGATAKHEFPERTLDVTDGLPVRVARSYDEARADVTVDGDKVAVTLRPDRRFQVAQRIKEETVTYSPAGPLNRDELELTSDHLDTLAVFSFLPAEPVAVGESWKVPAPVAQALARLEGLAKHELQGKLEEVKDGIAKVNLTGTVEGITGGAETTIAIDAHCLVDVNSKHWTTIEWKQKEDRKVGPASPGLVAESRITVQRSFGALPESLLNAIVETVPAQPNTGHVLVSFKEMKGRYEFLLDRGWQVLPQTENYAIFRLLDRGELIAQLNVIPKAKAKPGTHMSPDELTKLVNDAPGLMLEQVLQAGEVPNEDGHRIYRLSVVGQANGLRVLQHYYLVASPQGDQVLLTFTTEVPLVDKLAGRDLSIVASLVFPGDKKGKP